MADDNIDWSTWKRAPKPKFEERVREEKKPKPVVKPKGGGFLTDKDGRPRVYPEDPSTKRK
jgi:hypothetical protein